LDNIASITTLLSSIFSPSIQEHNFKTNIVYISLIVLAASSIANIVKSSLGPVGLDKMIVNEIGVSNRFGSRGSRKDNEMS
jgi:hypothetical protein